MPLGQKPSPHLLSRIEVGRILRSGPVPVTIFAGSHDFRIGKRFV